MQSTGDKRCTESGLPTGSPFCNCTFYDSPHGSQLLDTDASAVLWAQLMFTVHALLRTQTELTAPTQNQQCRTPPLHGKGILTFKLSGDLLETFDEGQPIALRWMTVWFTMRNAEFIIKCSRKRVVGRVWVWKSGFFPFPYQQFHRSCLSMSVKCGNVFQMKPTLRSGELCP